MNAVLDDLAMCHYREAIAAGVPALEAFADASSFYLFAERRTIEALDRALVSA